MPTTALPHGGSQESRLRRVAAPRIAPLTDRDGRDISQAEGRPLLLRAVLGTGLPESGVASVKINAETQNKVNRRDLSETKLFNEVFSEKAPEPGKARLRVVPNDGSHTFGGVHRGVRAFAEGCYSGIRNPTRHTIQAELPVDQALEQLAAFSFLARWADDATVDR